VFVSSTGEVTREEVLSYHSGERPGKLQMMATKPLLSQRDFSLAYTPGVAQAVEVVDEDPMLAYEYTTKGNLVAVVSNGTAILGLGNRGPIPAKPVMEGKALLFKQLADVDVFDIELDAATADEIVAAVKAIAPGFGGINLEDIAAPVCFEVEERLRALLDIPVFHDDQHGTAIISAAALLNALSLTGRDITTAKTVVLGAGAAGIACARMFVALGMPREQITMFDHAGMIFGGRTKGMNPYKAEFARSGPELSLLEALRGADVLLGVSAADSVTPEMLLGMAPKPILLLQANPDPEIRYELASETRPDAIVATGRSDYPNQVNNVLGFPFIFRGALDVRASVINEEMKRAATKALAALTREPVPDSVLRAYGLEALKFGPDYIIPKPNDYRVLEWVASAVAEAAMASGAARVDVNLEEYRERLRGIQQRGRRVIHAIVEKARRNPKRMVFVEGEQPDIQRAARGFEQDGFGKAILLGRRQVIEKSIADLDLGYEPEIVDPAKSVEVDEFARQIYVARQRKGVTRERAQELARNPIIFGLMMAREGEADGVLAGLTREYPSVLRPILQHIPLREGLTTAAGVFIVISGGRVYFFADCLVNIDPGPEELAEIAIQTADFARDFDVTPRIAMVSFSNFGASQHPEARKVRQAVEIVAERRPDLLIDGEMQASVAVSAQLTEERYPFSKVKGANVLVFSNLDASTTAFKVAAQLGGAFTLGPVLLGPQCSAHVLGPFMDVQSIILMGAMAVVEAQEREEHEQPEPGVAAEPVGAIVRR
jgi:malate dehydrogenase (oxaloacetate-decarboxylating)(NADP+)